MLRRPLAVHALTSTAFDGALKTKDMTATVTAADLAAAEVELTSDEQDLVQVLVAAAAAQQTTVRICGGWVRDKALGRVTKDVDVALDNCSGATFAERVVEALAKGLEGGDGRGAALAASSTVGLIAANPEQSKHLETATMRICGVEVDFVNLRSESYADAGDSRIPTMAFGTPQEDAARRDFTLNALFFNVHTRRIEDFTGRGWEDLRAGLLRTPPSRASRCSTTRSARCEACALPRATASRSTRASPRRACCPRSARRSSPRSCAARRQGGLGRARDVAGRRRARRRRARRLQLASATFAASAPRVGRRRARAGAARSRSTRSTPPTPTMRAGRGSSLRAAARRSPPARRNAAGPLPTRDATLAARASLPLAEPGCERLTEAAADAAASGRLQGGPQAPGPTATDDGATACCVRLDSFSQFLTHRSWMRHQLAKLAARLARRDRPDLRRDAGLVLFDVQELCAALRVARARCIAFEAANFRDGPQLPGGRGCRAAEREFGALETALAGPTLDLDRIWATLQPHYDGNALAEALDVPKGPLIGGLMAAQREWQLAQPAGDKEACLAYLRSRVEDLRQTHGQGRRGGNSKKARRILPA